MMPLIRLECSDDLPTTEWIERIEGVRDRFVASHSVDFSKESNLCPRLPPKLSFFALPEQQLLSYEKHRETSELGQVFQIANGLHDFIDAVVVTGSGADCCGVRALVSACWDPFHNELTRAARGSKPRLYFAGQDYDNDHLQSLIGRMTTGGYGDAAAEACWAIIAMDQPAASRTNDVLLGHLLQTLRQSHLPRHEALFSRLLTTIGGHSSGLAGQMNSLGFPQSLFVPGDIERGFGLLTPVGLLPSAFLGLDCIQLLVGAAAINQNFRDAPLSQNLVLRYVAGHLTRDDKHGLSQGSSAISFWSRSLVRFGDWIAKLQGTPIGRNGCLTDSGIEICNHFVVQSVRTDPLLASGDGTETKQERGPTLPELQDEAIAAARCDLAERGIRQNTITLPVIDTHSLGQLIQLMLLSSAILAVLESSRRA